MNALFVTNIRQQTRFHRFYRAILAGYGIVIANIFYTGASIPLALHFLGKDQFGLWAVAQQVAGYLVLFELGVSSASSRLISNFKDNPSSIGYRNIFWSSAVLFLLLGVFIFFIGICFSLFLPYLLKLPEQVHPDFQKVLFLLTLSTALTISLRAFSTPLWAFQRMDVLNGGSIMFLLLSLFFMPLLFLSGWGLLSLPLSFFPGIFLACFLNIYVCVKNGFYPSLPQGFRPVFSFFGQTLRFGSDILLLNLGGQLANSAPLLCATRVLSLADVATLAIGLKMLNLFQNLFQKVMQNAAPGLTEIYVRGEIPLFIRRFRHVLLLSAFLGGFGALLLNLGNSPFVLIWTGGQIQFPSTANLFIGALLALSSVTFCFYEVFSVKGQLQPIRFFRFFEGGLACLFCLFGGWWFGLGGLLAGACLAALIAAIRIIRQLKMDSLSAMIPEKRLCLALFCVAASTFTIQFPQDGQFRVWFPPLISVLCLVAIARILVPWDLVQEIRSRVGTLRPPKRSRP